MNADQKVYANVHLVREGRARNLTGTEEDNNCNALSQGHLRRQSSVYLLTS